MFDPSRLMRLPQDLTVGGVVSGIGTAWVLLGFAALLLLLFVGAGVVYWLATADTRKIRAAGARHPRDWPRHSEIVRRDGYAILRPRQVLTDPRYSGAFRIGQLYPSFPLYHLVPDVWPLSRFRDWLAHTQLREIWVPESKRYEHFAVVGPTGAGKSTGYIFPMLTFGAYEKDTSLFVIDVKSPEFAKLFAPLYRRAGKKFYFFDPYRPSNTLAFEPVWRASEGEISELAEVISTYSTGQGEDSKNSGFFKDNAKRTLKTLLTVGQFWPRQYCSLPALQQWILAGNEKIEAGVEAVDKYLRTPEEVMDALRVVATAEVEELRKLPRDPEAPLSRALEVLNVSGYQIASWCRRMRRFHQEYETGLRDKASYEAAWVALEEKVREEVSDREYRCRKLKEGFGEFKDMAGETKGGVMSTIGNQMERFRDRDLSRAFSRDELRMEWLVQGPCLLLVGAPMRKKDTGALFVASILSNMAIKSVFTRAAVMDTGEGKAWMGGAHFVLDELPQLNVTRLVEALATFRGYKGAIYGAWQDRAQMKTQYGEDVTTVEGNMKTQATLPGLHIETCKHYSDTVGEVNIRKVSESVAAGQTTKSESIESVPRISAADLHDMRINGVPRRDLALITGGISPPFIARVQQHFADPTIRKLLDLRRRVKKPSGLLSQWAFWRYEDRWDPEPLPLDDLYIKRREADPGNPECPVRLRGEDPYNMYVEFLVGRPTERVQEDGAWVTRPVYDALEVPRLDLEEVTTPGRREPSPRAAPGPDRAGARPRRSEPVARQRTGLPSYRKDIEKACFRDTQPPATLPSREALPIGGSIEDRIDGDPEPDTE